MATKFNKPFNGPNGTNYNYGSTYPKGCFAVSREYNAKNIYFNNHKTGSERSDFVSFCKNQPSKKPEVIKTQKPTQHHSFSPATAKVPQRIRTQRFTLHDEDAPRATRMWPANSHWRADGS